MLLLQVVLVAFFVQANATYNKFEWTSPDEHYQILKYCDDKQRTNSKEDEFYQFRRLLVLGDNDLNILPQIKISNFTWSACPQTISYAVNVHRLGIIGDTLLPGYAKIAFDITSLIDVNSDFTVDVEASKLILGSEVSLPCINNIGSCTFSMKCDSASETAICPDEFKRNNLPCSCPIKKGNYKANMFKIFLGIEDATDIPGWLTNGHYTATVKIQTDKQTIFCLKTELDISQPF